MSFLYKWFNESPLKATLTVSVGAALIFGILAGAAFYTIAKSGGKHPDARQDFPVVILESHLGLSGASNISITSEMSEKFREGSIQIHNTSGVDMRNLRGRVVFPEPALRRLPSFSSLRIEAPIKTTVRWEPEKHPGVFSGSGGGHVMITDGDAAKVWLLQIDDLPAFSSVTVPFLSVEGFDSQFGGYENDGKETDLSEEVLFIFNNYTNVEKRWLWQRIEGSYQVPNKEGGWSTFNFMVPILFERKPRTMTSLPVEESTSNWKFVGETIF